MLELHLFGSVALRRRGVGASVATIVQTKRLALLAYLATAPRRRHRRRDTTLGLFWADADDLHARAALSQALSYLRRAMGNGVIVTQGDEEVGVDASLLWTDAVAFREAFDGGDYATALGIYRGTFLDGFFVDGASEDFERWLAAERDQFRLQATSAATKLAEEAEAKGALGEAVGWAARGAALSPGDEQAAARHIRLLALAGDRAGALRAYDALRERLRAEYNVAPSPETRAILAAILAR